MAEGRRNHAAVRGAEDDDGALSGVLVELTAQVGAIREAMSRQAARGPRVPFEACHPVTFLGQIPLSSGAGSLSIPDLYGPHDPYYWDVRALAFSGFTAGTVTVAENNTGALPIAQTTAIGQFTWSAQNILSPRDWLVFSATGVTGSVNFVGLAIEIETAWLPDYLM